MHKIASRKAASVLMELARTFPIVAITGPRQSGKTTLARVAFPDKAYVSLEDPDVREAAQNDPREFLGELSEGAVIDEVQRVPELFSYLQGVVDRDRSAGRFVLTGSHQFLLNQEISQSLSGRAGYLKLLPLTIDEARAGAKDGPEMDECLWRGFYPPPALHGANPRLWYGAYVETYLERDVRQLVNVRDLSTFQRFLRLCAGRTGSLLDIGGLGNEASVDYKTTRHWLSVLEASFVIHLLKPHHQNFNKRLVKKPKLYFLDTGLAAWLIGIKEPGQLKIHPLRGNLFESLVVSEILKHQYNQAEPADLYFWRDSRQNEVDILLDRGVSHLAIEVKSSQTLKKSLLEGLDYWRRLDPEENKDTLLVYAGDDSRRQQRGHAITHWRNLSRALK